MSFLSEMKAMGKKSEAIIEQLHKEDKAAKKSNTMLGRFVTEEIAYGLAYYKIIKVNKKTVVVEWVPEIYDEYISYHWGEKATVDKTDIKFRLDFTDTFFPNN